jgi:hypothetical protein
MRSSRVGVGPAPQGGVGPDARLAADARVPRCCGAGRRGGRARGAMLRCRDCESGRAGRAAPGAAWGQMPGSRRTRTGCSAEQMECRSQARAVRRGRVAALWAACAQGGGAAAARAAWGASRLRGGPASCAALMPLVYAVFRWPLLSRSVARRASLSHCLPAAALRSRGTFGLGGRPVPRAPLLAPGCSVREGSAAPPRAKRSAKMAKNDDLTTGWGRFRQTEGCRRSCNTRCESRDLGFCSPAFLTSARSCRQVVAFGHFSTRDYVRVRRRARCGAGRRGRGAAPGARRGAAEPPRSSLRGAAGGRGCSCPSHRRRSTWRNSKMILPVSGGKILRGSRQRPVEKA